MFALSKIWTRIDTKFRCNKGVLVGGPHLGQGVAYGMVIVPDAGESVYFAGDTGAFGDMELIGKLCRPYVSVLPIGGKYTMGVREAADAMEMLRSKYLVPGHYNTFKGDTTDTDELVRHVWVRAPATEVCLLQPGESFSTNTY